MVGAATVPCSRFAVRGFVTSPCNNLTRRPFSRACLVGIAPCDGLSDLSTRRHTANYSNE